MQYQAQDQLGKTIIKPFRQGNSGLSNIVESIVDEKGLTYQRVKPKSLKKSDQKNDSGRKVHVKLDGLLSIEKPESRLTIMQSPGSPKERDGNDLPDITTRKASFDVVNRAHQTHGLSLQMENSVKSPPFIPHPQSIGTTTATNKMGLTSNISPTSRNFKINTLYDIKKKKKTRASLYGDNTDLNEYNSIPFLRNTLSKQAMTENEEEQQKLLKPVAVKEFRMNRLNFDEMIFGGDTSINMKLENTLSKRSGSLKISPRLSTVKNLLTL